MKGIFMKIAQDQIGVREDLRTGQFFPTINGRDISPTSFSKERALEIARDSIADDAPITGEWAE